MERAWRLLDDRLWFCFFFDIQDFSREEMVFWELDEKCLDEVAADWMGEAMEEAVGLTIVKSETAEAPVEEPC